MLGFNVEFELFLNLPLPQARVDFFPALEKLKVGVTLLIKFIQLISILKSTIAN